MTSEETRRRTKVIGGFVALAVAALLLIVTTAFGRGDDSTPGAPQADGTPVTSPPASIGTTPPVLPPSASPTPSPTPSKTPKPKPTKKKPVVRKPPVTASGVALPVGNLPGWRQVFREDFSTPLARGNFPGPYAKKWVSYDGFQGTWKSSWYENDIISVKNGAMDFALHTKNGKALTAAPSPVIGKPWSGQTYGRYTVRFRSEALKGYKTAWLLWSEDDDWNKGEVDFPEGDLDGQIHGFNHCVGNAAKTCYQADTGKRYTSWHTATLEWSPGKLTYLLDGKKVGGTDHNVPSTPMKWILQTEGSSDKVPHPSVAGHLQIDWVSVYAYNPK